jgi:hypothetical protein
MNQVRWIWVIENILEGDYLVINALFAFLFRFSVRMALFGNLHIENLPSTGFMAFNKKGHEVCPHGLHVKSLFLTAEDCEKSSELKAGAEITS